MQQKEERIIEIFGQEGYVHLDLFNQKIRTQNYNTVSEDEVDMVLNNEELFELQLHDFLRNFPDNSKSYINRIINLTKLFLSYKKWLMKNLFNLKNKVIIITGGVGLLGKQHAKAIAEYGGTPVIIDLNSNKIKAFIEYLNERYNVRASGYKVDITEENEVKKNCNNILKKYGKIDGLINNASNNPKLENDQINND